jgi:hypothetical protein
MKTYYDLSKSERKNYLKDFKKTPVGKEINEGHVLLNILAFIVFVASFILSYYEVSDTLSEIFWIIFVLCAIIDAFIMFYENVNFTAWLKNKHDIKRW